MNSSHLIIDYNVAPDVFKKVIEAKILLASGKYKSVNEVLEKINLSRTAFYKYKNHIFLSDESDADSIITFAFTLDDVTGILSEILALFAKMGTSVLTINQNIPVNGIANITISLRINSSAVNKDDIIERLKKIKGVNRVHILAMSV